MAAAKKTANESNEPNIDNFKAAIINLGIKLCKEIEEGKAREPQNTLVNIASLYNSIK